MPTLPQLLTGLQMNPSQEPGEADSLFLAGVAAPASGMTPPANSTTEQMGASLATAGLDTTGIDKVSQS